MSFNQKVNFYVFFFFFNSTFFVGGVRNVADSQEIQIYYNGNINHFLIRKNWAFINRAASATFS